MRAAHWYRLKARVLPLVDEQKNPFYIWQISDITAEREQQERFFRELQNAIDYLDHAPVGFLLGGQARARSSISMRRWPTGLALTLPSSSRAR